MNSMAKKKQQQKMEAVNAVPVQNEGAQGLEETDDEELELLQVDVGDMVKLKQILDETVACTILENVKEDYRIDNAKLGVMAAACLFAVVAQFAPIPFPESRPVLGVCCCIYFVLSGILQFITTFIDKDCILLTRPLETASNTNMQEYGLRVRSALPRFSEFYTLTLQFQNMPDTPQVTQKWSVGNFFDVEGMFDEVGLMQAVQEVYKRLEGGLYDKSSTSSSASQPSKKKKD